MLVPVVLTLFVLRRLRYAIFAFTRTCTVLGAGGRHDVLCLFQAVAYRLSGYWEIFVRRWQRRFGTIWIRRGLSYHVNGVRGEESSGHFNDPFQRGRPWLTALYKTFESPLPFSRSGSKQNPTFVDPSCRLGISESVHD
jgi:hypothetical protein